MNAPQISVFVVRAYIRDRIHEEDRGHSTPCWVWQLRLKSDGYGVGCLPGTGKTVRMARASHEAYVGPIKDGLQIDHLCRQPSCCNPDHLEAVSNIENMARQAAARTHCKRGHIFAGENLTFYPNGARTCRTCRSEWDRSRQAKRVAA